MRTRVYIDGFNLFYGCLKRTPYRWLDLELLARKLIPKDAELDAILYFTARVKAQDSAGTSATHQAAYLRALSTRPTVTIHFGQFQTTTVRARLADPNAIPVLVEVLKTEEKGSDVNLASHLLLDAAKDKFDAAVVLTNDSDLTTPISMVVRELQKQVYLYPPATRKGRRISKELSKIEGIRMRELRERSLADSQFADVIHTSDGGVITRPSEWK